MFQWKFDMETMLYEKGVLLALIIKMNEECSWRERKYFK